MTYLTYYVLTLIPLLILDGLWLGLIARPYYIRKLEPLLAENMVWSAAAVFYLLYAAGLLKFAVLPGAEEGSTLKALQLGAMLGCIAYAAYDLTNMTTLRGWSWQVTIIDMAWGTAASGAVAAIAVWLIQLTK